MDTPVASADDGRIATTQRQRRGLATIGGIAHFIGCPHDGAASVLLKLGLLPGALGGSVFAAHERIVDAVALPLEFILETHEHAHTIAHHSVDAIGWAGIAAVAYRVARRAYTRIGTYRSERARGAPYD